MKFRTLLLGLSALFVAFNAAFFSVSGLSKLFAGAAFSVIIMASSLELAKLITASYLYNYWERINKSFRIYLSGAVLILILITSLGIYGFLTSAFQDTFNQYTIKEKQLEFLEQKEKFWGDDVIRYDEELKRISSNISTLSNAKSQSIEVRDTSVVGGVRRTISTSELRISQKRIEVEEENRKGVQSKREVAADSLQTIQLKILDVESMEGVSSELGPLQYLSGLLDKPMDVIINWLILIIIFVFDPLAVALVIAFSNALKVDRGIVDKEKVIRKRELYDEIPEDEDDTGGWEDDDSDDREEHLQTIIDNDQEMGLWDNTINDGLEDDEDVQDFLEQQDSYESDDSDKLFTVAGMTNDKEQSFNEFQKKQDEFDKADLNKDGVVTEEETRINYEEYAWRNSFKGAPFYTHPWFDWSKRERWVNDREAINYWLNNKGGNRTALDEFLNKTKYPDNFDKKTY
jgi:hypothetical protein